MGPDSRTGQSHHQERYGAGARTGPAVAVETLRRAMSLICEDFEDRCQDRLLVEKMLSILTPRQRFALQLWMHGRTYKDIGEEIGSAGPPHSSVPLGAPISGEQARTIINNSIRRIKWHAQKRWRLIEPAETDNPPREAPENRIIHKEHRHVDAPPAASPAWMHESVSEWSPRETTVELFVYDPSVRKSVRYTCTAVWGIPDEKWELAPRSRGT